ncbi:MAG: Rrf2 family transcriptional regulator [Candidatus Kapabacteria bacterium]|nr:Rrf2 family transcriptional regulator [Candidatus Kapabacteria bacterium]
MFFTKTCNYGIQAMIYLALMEKGKYVSIKIISEELSMSVHFLTKILQPLTAAGLLTSYKGPNGGVLLAKDSNKISLYDVVAVLDKPEKFTSCMMGLKHCGTGKPCPFHEEWAPIRDKMHSECVSTTLADLAVKARTDEYRYKEELM